jgi:hypothetical protein
MFITNLESFVAVQVVMHSTRQLGFLATAAAPIRRPTDVEICLAAVTLKARDHRLFLLEIRDAGRLNEARETVMKARADVLQQLLKKHDTANE